MSKTRVPLKVKLAAALLQLRDEAGAPLIDYEHTKAMSAAMIISLFHADHYPVREADGGPTEPWNITMRMIAPHRIKTAEKDIPEMAKSRRVRDGKRPPPAGAPIAQKSPQKGPRLRSRGFRKDGPKQKIQSRGFAKRRKLRT